ncbi:hypothetical protein GCM10025867_49010 (plasmid) [Frondihabitans sucicola]|uniref:DUF732 domain-containing protein n=2 Tax=Frondihabitans sucicola TaxID=1268041 RepID=A0ABM8GVZ8_9MICO|nr:hypothetical protein GCM10025867_49010 [Frondihabitans sucicola]
MRRRTKIALGAVGLTLAVALAGGTYVYASYVRPIQEAMAAKDQALDQVAHAKEAYASLATPVATATPSPAASAAPSAPKASNAPSAAAHAAPAAAPVRAPAAAPVTPESKYLTSARSALGIGPYDTQADGTLLKMGHLVCSYSGIASRDSIVGQAVSVSNGALSPAAANSVYDAAKANLCR